jgi:hypothetical protein
MKREDLQRQREHSALMHLLITYSLGAGAFVLVIGELAGCVFSAAWRSHNNWWSLQLGRHYTELYRIAAVTVAFSVASIVFVAVGVVVNICFPDKKHVELVFWLFGYLFFFVALICEGVSIDYTKYGNAPVLSQLNLLKKATFYDYYLRYVEPPGNDVVPLPPAQSPYKKWSKVRPTDVLLDTEFQFLEGFVKQGDKETVARIYRRTDLSAYMQPFYSLVPESDPALDRCVSCAINWSAALEKGAFSGANPCDWDFGKVPTADHMCIGGWTPKLLQEYWCDQYTEAKGDDDCDIAHPDADDWTCVKERAVRERAWVTQYSLAAMYQNNQLLIGIQIVGFVFSCVAVWLDMLFRDPEMSPYGPTPDEEDAIGKASP